VASNKINVLQSSPHFLTSALGKQPMGGGSVRTLYFLAKVHAWAEEQDDKPGRPEAICRLLELGLKAKAK
jgi:hypothetical protein